MKKWLTLRLLLLLISTGMICCMSGEVAAQTEGERKMPELKKAVRLTAESTADYAGVQLRKSGTDEFDARILAVLDDTKFETVGCRIVILRTEKTGVASEKTVDMTSTKVYETIRAEGNEVTAASLGGKYAATFTVEKLPVNAGKLTLVVRLYAIVNGAKLYGRACVLTGSGGSLAPARDEIRTITASADTFIQ